MHTQVLIVLAGILFCATTMQGRGLSYQEKRVSHQERHKSKYGDKRYFIETARSLHRQKVQHLRQKLEHNRRDFDDEQKQFQDQMLEAINLYRSIICSPPLTLDDELSAGAQQYAEHLAKIGSLEPSQTEGVGENLYVYDDPDGTYSVYSTLAYIAGYEWFAELQQYDFENGGFSPETKQFTQLVWRSTEKLGVGIGFNSDRTKVYVVAHFSPPGNQAGEFKDNVVLEACY